MSEDAARERHEPERELSEAERQARQLAQSQALLRIAGRLAKVGGWSVMLPDRRLIWSDDTAAIHGEPAGCAPPLDQAFGYYLEEHRQRVRDAFERCARDGVAFDLEAEILTARGERVWVHAIGEAVRDAAGEIIQVQGAFQDVSEVKNAAAEVRDLGARLVDALETTTDAVLMADGEWRFTYLNAQAERLLGRSSQELLGRTLWSEFPEAVGTTFEQAYRRVVAERIAITMEDYYAPFDAWFEVRAFPTEDGITVYFRDVTERHTARQALLEREERFRLLSRATNDAIWDWNLVADEVWWNDGIVSLFGYAFEDVEPTSSWWTDRLHPDDHDRVYESIHQVIEGTAESWVTEYRFRRSGGDYAHVVDRGYVIRDATGKAVRMLGGMTDISERREAEERLRAQATLLDHARDAILVRDLDHRITYWNNGAERLYGWTAGEALGRSVTELICGDQAAFLAATERLLRGGEWIGELEQVNRAGEPRTIEARWTLLRDDDGRPKAVLAIDTDVTERKLLERQFLRAQRMESIGTLAGGIAHDLNNVLVPILMSVSLLEAAELDDDRKRLLGIVQASARRGAELVSQVMSFARGIEGQQVAVQPGKVIGDVMALLAETLPKNIRLEARVAPGLWTLQADPTQLHQVLLNLAVNARDAMPDGGRLLIAAENVVLDQQRAAAELEAQVGPYVKIEVRDTGGGIPREIQDKIFDPFFTTKPVGKGTGLGLSTSLNIVKGHRGFIRVNSEAGAGARFVIHLPASPLHAAPGAAADVTAGTPRGRGELVLVVDDEPLVGEVTRKVLEKAGYRVIVAADGLAAVALYRSHPNEIAVVLTDMRMPVLDGPAAIRELQRLDPGVRVIGASGLSGEGEVAEVASSGVRHFLAKPYTADTLLWTVRRALEE